jgi:hypothetical protein
VRRRQRQLLAGLAASVLVVSTGVIVTHFAGNTAPATAGIASEGELTPAMEGHLEALKRAAPASNEESLEGPGSAADAAFEARAYPAGTISRRQMDNARASYEKARGRPFPSGKGRKGTWTSVGPNQAVYPFTPFRHSFNYVPNEYVAGGRTTSIALSTVCQPDNCAAWITPAGGGVWRTNNILEASPKWKYLGGPLGINAAGSVTVDKNDPTGRTIYAGTGEANVCGSGCVAGVGLYKSTNGGDSWIGPLGKAELGGKGIGEIVIKPGDPNTLYVGTTTALRGMTSVCCSGVTRPVPDAQKWGLYKSSDGGKTWSFLHNGSANAADCTGSQAEYNNQAACSPRGVRHVELDPSDSNIVYASSYARGIWRSTDAGGTWTQIKESLAATAFQTRAAFDVTKLANGKTRMYVYEGNIGTPYSRLFRSDDVSAGAPVYQDLTSANVADNGYAWYNICGGQCWYDVFVYTPDGHPDIVYAGGAYVYGETIANKRAVVLSTDAGATGTDMTFDGTDELHPNGLHPDQHDIVTHPDNPFLFFETNDGGVMRSSGGFVDRSSWCDDSRRRLNDAQKNRCRQMLSRIPSKLDSLNNGLATLQFQSLSVSPHDSALLQGGTQDNGTWQSENINVWNNTIIGDGGQSGFDIARPEFRFHNYTGVSPEVNFDNGDVGKWIYTAGPFRGNAAEFYSPVISDPRVSGTMFAGSGDRASTADVNEAGVYRTKSFGLGNRSYEQALQDCNTWTVTNAMAPSCGDWVRVGPALTDASLGDRAGGNMAAVERTKADTSAAWAATTTGRVFISRNVDADSAGDVSWTRLDDDAVTPNRFVSSIYVDPANGNRAWISYSGFDMNTPNTPGHVFEVTFNPATGQSTWINRSYDFGDLPVTDLVRDDRSGDLYASSDFGVLRLAAGTTTWTAAAPGLPNVEVAGLTILPEEGILYAATHGLSAWRLNITE